MGGRPTYIIYTPGYDENGGGSIVLHKLCHILNELGESALLWPMRPLNPQGLWRRLHDLIAPKRFNVSPSLLTPIAEKKKLDHEVIVLYPEIIPGNPLGACNVARWLLNKPGFLTGRMEFGRGDLYFKFDDFCDDLQVTGGNSQQLFLFSLNPCYQDKGNTNRSGSCYIFRKGKGRPLVHDLRDSVQIDGLSHEEIANIFNRTRVFYSYDEETMYSQFAAMCGCISIVIPASGKSREEWARGHRLSRYGIAYGLDDIDHAVTTKHLVHHYLRGLENEAAESVRRFVTRTYDYFGFHEPR